MAQYERIRKLDRLLLHNRCLTRSRALQELEVSPSTLNRDVAQLRRESGMTIRWVAEREGWEVDRSAGRQFELPGLSFEAEEVYPALVEKLSASHAAREAARDKLRHLSVSPSRGSPACAAHA